MTETVLSIRGVRKTFGTVRALQGVDLDLQRGEIIGLIGDNGAGKSTLIKILSGFERPDEGRILLDGEPVQFASPAEARSRGIETVYQEQALADDLSVERNLFLGKEPVRKVGPFRFLDLQRMRTESQAMLDELRLRMPVGQETRFLSGGERQGIAIARAIHFDARVVILDEPTNALGVAAVERVLKLISELKERGIGCIFVSHNLAHVHAIVDRVVLFVHGTKMLDLPVGKTTLEALNTLLLQRSGARIERAS